MIPVNIFILNQIRHTNVIPQELTWYFKIKSGIKINYLDKLNVYPGKAAHLHFFLFSNSIFSAITASKPQNFSEIQSLNCLLLKLTFTFLKY